MYPVAWKTCPDFNEFDCCFNGDIRRKDENQVILHVLVSSNKGKRSYLSLTEHWFGDVHRQVFKAFGPPNPDPSRYTLIDHTDNNPFNNHINNLRWSNAPLNALNTNSFRGWSIDKSNGRACIYRVQVKWQGTANTIGRLKTASEAEAAYNECKDWIQEAYREHFYEDKYLVKVWKAYKFVEDFMVSADPDRQLRAERNFDRMLTPLKKYLKAEGRLSFDY